jgi:hypothetical protein
VKIITSRLKNLPRISKITKTGRNTTVSCLTTSHSSWMVRWLRPHGMLCTVWGYHKNETPAHPAYKCMFSCMNNICTCSGSVQQLYFRMICHLCPLWSSSGDKHHTVLPKLKAQSLIKASLHCPAEYCRSKNKAQRPPTNLHQRSNNLPEE